MKQVKVYVVKEEEHLCYPSQKFLEIRAAGNPGKWKPVSIGDEVAVDMYVNVEHLPIESYHWSNGKHMLAVMSNELREIIGIEVDKQEDMKERIFSLKKELSHKNSLYNKYYGIVEAYETMSFWQRVKWAFKGA